MKRQFAIFSITSIFISMFGLLYLPGVWEAAVEAAPPGTVVKLKAAAPSDYTITELEEAQQVLDQRLARLDFNGRYEIVIREDEMQLEVNLPPLDNVPQVIDVITRVGEVKFVDAGSQVPSSGLVLSAEVFPTLFSRADIRSVVPPEPGTGELFYQIVIQPDAIQKLDAIGNQPENNVCLALDNAIASCSTMYQRTGDTLEILPSTGDNDISISEMALFLATGPLPVPLEIVE
jgi:hypothetical protein